MPITRIDKYLETEDLGITHSLGIESDLLDSCVSEIKRRKIKGIFGCPVFGFKEDNFDFMHEIQFVVQVWFWEMKLKNIEGIYSLSDLEYFGVMEKRPAIDFSRLPKLEKVVWHPIRKDQGLESLSKLKQLDVWRYKSKEKNYANLQLPENIEKLDLNWCNPISLDQMQEMPNLKELQIHYCRNIESINSITRVAPNLKCLVITHCANLENYSIVQDLNLDHLYINIKGKTVANNAFKQKMS